MIIQVKGPIAYETAARLYQENKETVENRFARFFIKQFMNIKKPENCQADGAAYVAEIGELGLFGSLWELGVTLGGGLRIDLEDVPIGQEIVEILELFNESPYECASSGSFVAAADFLMEGWAQVGRTTKEKARVIYDGETERFLTPPSRQEKDIADRREHRLS